MKKLCHIILASVFIIAFATPAAADTPDVGLQLGASYTHKFNFGLNATVAEELRLKDNVSKFAKNEVSLGLSYGLLKKQLAPLGIKVRVEGEYSFTYRNFYREKIKKKKTIIYDFNYPQHRLNLGLSVSKRLGSIVLKDKVRYQYDRRLPGEEYDFRVNPRSNLREKLTLAYSPKNRPYSFHLAGEIYIPLNDPDYSEITEVRAALGASYDINKRNSLDLTLRYHHERTGKYPDRLLLISLEYSFANK